MASFSLETTFGPAGKRSFTRFPPTESAGMLCFTYHVDITSFLLGSNTIRIPVYGMIYLSNHVTYVIIFLVINIITPPLFKPETRLYFPPTKAVTIGKDDFHTNLVWKSWYF